MFDQIASNLKDWLKNLRKSPTLTEKDLQPLWSDLRVKLLESDVHFKVTKEIIESLQRKIAENPLQNSGQSAEVIFYRYIYDTLKEILGNTTVEPNWHKPYLALLVGLNGMGKTTFAAKFAYWIRTNRKLNVGLLTLDDQRPAAFDQLKVLAQQAQIAFFDQPPTRPFDSYLQAALQWQKSIGLEALIVDTAGRHQLQDDLIEELVPLTQNFSWNDCLLVIDSGFGQQSVNLVQGFKAKLPLTGVVATRVDADSKAGALLSIRWITGLPIKFFSAGEKISDIEVFHPDRIVKRILDLGDLETLIEKTQFLTDSEDLELDDQQERLKKGKLSLEDFLQQMKWIRRLGGFEGVLKYLPGFQMLRQQQEALSKAKDQLKKWEAIILSMTPEERKNPAILNGSRKNRIAKGSGTQIQDVNQLIQAYEQMQQVLKLLTQGDPRQLLNPNVVTKKQPPFWKHPRRY